MAPKVISSYPPDRWIRTLNQRYPNLWMELKKSYDDPYSMNGRQFNFLLMQQGFLDGCPGSWSLTLKGEQFAVLFVKYGCADDICALFWSTGTPSIRVTEQHKCMLTTE